MAENRFFQISNSFSKYWPKSKKYSNEERGVNIDLSAMYSISMDSSRKQMESSANKWKAFFQILIFFELLAENRKIFE